jgi:hypothetical protein
VGKFWNWLTVADAKKPTATATNIAHVNYASRRDVKVDISGDIDYVLKLLPIVAKQLEAADGRLTDAA